MIPKVSVCIITYNHEKYIGEAIESVLNQKIDFPIEVIIGEDHSTDGTKKIIQKYIRKFPKLFEVSFNKKNIGIVPNFIKTIKRCKGKYIALLEGDDYWIDINKLKKQINYLDKHPKCNITSHNCYVINEQNKNNYHEWLGRNRKRKSFIEDIIGTGSGGATCSLVIRNCIFIDLPNWFYKLPSSDWATQILATSGSYMYYFPQVMGVYRQHKNSATDYKNNWNKLLQAYTRGGSDLCEIFDKHFKYKYHKYVEHCLVNYMYPNIVNVYIKLFNIKMAGLYSKKILNFDVSLSVWDKFKYKILQYLSKIKI